MNNPSAKPFPRGFVFVFLLGCALIFALIIGALVKSENGKREAQQIEEVAE